MTAPAEEFTELVDANIPRVDLVDKAANGMRFLIAKQADGSAGLMPADLVRELVAKSDPTPGEQVTMTGSPGALARLIHEAAQRTPAPVAKADISTADINDLPDSAFAYIEAGGHKDEHGRTTPRSLRHFPIHDAAHVRNALSRAPQSPFGDKAMPKIRAAAKKFGIEVAKEIYNMADDDLDPTTALAEPDMTAPGNPTTPTSPAWEAIDAATARKWTAILARARSAVDLLAEREMLEAASGAEDDAQQACDLQDACAAIDYAISILAPFAVAEMAESEMAEQMAMVGKALDGWDPTPLTVIEALGAVRKAGRVLSAQNEAAIRGAVDSLQKVLASLPAAPVAKDMAAQPLADEKEAEMPHTTTSAEVVARSGQQPKMGVAKADDVKPQMRAVYDAKGHLIGVVDPADVTPIADAEPDGDEPDGDGPDGDEPQQTTDLTPQPSSEAGTPANAVDDGVAKQTTDNSTTSDAVLKSIADVVKAQLDAYSATQAQTIAAQAEALAAVTETLTVLKGQVHALEEQPAEPKVFTNGAVPPAHMLRGQDHGAAPIDVTKAAELRKTLYRGTAPEQNQAAVDMQALAIAELQKIHQQRR